MQETPAKNVLKEILIFNTSNGGLTMKRLLSFILSAGLVLSLAACEKATTNSEP